MKFWLNEIKTQSSPEVKIFMIGNKIDLENKRKVSKEEGDKFAKDNKIDLFMEASAKSGINAENIFIQAARVLYTEHLKFKDKPFQKNFGNNNTQGVKLPSPSKPNKTKVNIDSENTKKGGCC